ncbi:MAG TPA: sugar ABC transporter permease [Clostridiaceae bacterium]|jgi:putative aldouronate transport system permease protein|nr:sugar ABC transporter permease [Clostridiaceae bacterium]
MIKKLSKDEIMFHLMLLPTVVVLLIYNYFPIIGGLMIAFKKYLPTQGILKSQWVGFDNFKFIFSFPDFRRALINTLSIASMKIVTELFISIMFALLLNEVGKSFVKRSLQTIVYLPHFVSWVLLSGIIIDILSPSYGIVNHILGFMGIKPIFFLGDNQWFPATIVITHVWKEFGWNTIIYLAALSGIDPTLYEAAIVDGAGRWKQTIHVTLPGISSIIILMMTLSLGGILSAGFDQIYNLYNPIVYQSGDIIDTFVFRIGFQSAQFSVATAAGLFQSVVSFILIMVSYKAAYRYAGYTII